MTSNHKNLPNYLSLSPKNFHGLHLQKNSRPQSSINAQDAFETSKTQNPDKFIIDFENGRPKTSFARSHPTNSEDPFKTFRRSPNLSFFERRNSSNPIKNSVVHTEEKNQSILSKKPNIKI